MNDPIVDEVRHVREAQAARFNYDLDAIFQHIKAREKQYGLVFNQGVARQPQSEPEPRLIGTAHHSPTRFSELSVDGSPADPPSDLESKAP